MNLRHTRAARVAFAFLAIAVCLLLMREAARIGFSRLLTRYALTANSLQAADQALQLTPGAERDAIFKKARHADTAVHLGRLDQFIAGRLHGNAAH